MFTVTQVRKKLESAFSEKQAFLLADVIVDAYSDLVKTGDFNELKAIVKDLAQAQKRTEIKVEELAEAQKRTEIKVEELAEAQKRTEVELRELSNAQRRTEEELRLLVKEHKETRKQLGGLSGTVGYGLEDKAYKALPELLKRDFGVIVEAGLKRGYVRDKEGNDIEVNIIGRAVKNNKEINIVGEGKAQLSKNDVNDFIKKKLNRLEGVYKEIFPVIVTYMISAPDVEGYLKENGITLYYSYEF